MKREIVKQLEGFLRGEWVILGIGNRLRGDDGFGSIVAERLGKVTSSERIFDGGVAPENFLGKIAKLNPRSMLILDAVVFDGEPAELRIFTPDDFGEQLTLTHGPTDFKLIKSFLGDVDMRILAANPVSVKFGAKLSPQIDKCIDDVVLTLATILVSR